MKIMRNWKINNGLTVLGVLSLLFLTYFRENFLLEINAALAHDVYNRAYFYWLSGFFQEKSIAELTEWKWGITLVFSLIMSIITIAALYAWHQSKELFKLTVLIYFIVFLFFVVIAICGMLFGEFSDIYFVLRKGLGVIQSPLPFFGFYVLFYKMKVSNIG